MESQEHRASTCQSGLADTGGGIKIVK